MKVRNMFFYIILVLLFVSKTIESPVLLNVSPADFFWPILGGSFVWKFFMEKNYRDLFLKNWAWNLVMLLFVWGIIASMISFQMNTPVEINSLSFLSSLFVNGVKSLLIVGYFTLGLWTSKRVERQNFQIWTWAATVLFCIVILMAFLKGIPRWAIGDQNRIIGTVNDPNIASWICLLGLICSWSIVSGSRIGDDRRYEFINIMVILSVPLLVISLILTGSRTGLAGLLLIGVLLWISLRRNWRRIILTMIAALIISSGMIFIDHEFLGDKVYSQIADRVFTSIERASDSRELLRTAAFKMGLDHSLFGVGIGQFPNFSTPYYESLGQDISSEYFKTTISPKVPHNAYATYFAERGAFGLLIYLFLIGISIKRSESGPQMAFIIILALYSMNFTIENFRLAWFFWGGLSILIPSKNSGVDISLDDDSGLIQNEQLTSKKINKRFKRDLVLWAITIISILTFSKAIGQLYRTGLEMQGQKVSIYIDESGLDMTLELTGADLDPIFIQFDGTEKKEIIVRNDSGFYYDHFNLKPGDYEITFDSGSKNRKMNFMRLQSGVEDVFVYGHLIQQLGLGSQRMDDTYSQRFKMSRIEDLREYENVMYEKISIKYMNKSSGVNFENQISLKSLQLEQLEEPNQYQITWTFSKIGEINEPYILLARAYDLRDSRLGHAVNLKKNIPFETPLTKLGNGDTFTANWTFNTEGRPYMVMYGFYYKNPNTGSVYQPYPKYVRQGYIQ